MFEPIEKELDKKYETDSDRDEKIRNLEERLDILEQELKVLKREQ